MNIRGRHRVRRIFMDIRDRIEFYRNKRGWSRLKLAEMLEISYTALKNWYNEKQCQPSLRTIQKACAVFDITMTEMFSGVSSEESELSIEKRALLEVYDKLSPRNKKVVMALAKGLAEE